GINWTTPHNNYVDNWPDSSRSCGRKPTAELAGFPCSSGLLLVDHTHTLTLGMSFEQRIHLAVDEAHSAFTHAKVEGLIRRAQLRYPNADLRRLDMLEERGLNRDGIAQLATCAFIDRQHNAVFQGFTGPGKSNLGSALAQQACNKQN